MPDFVLDEVLEPLLNRAIKLLYDEPETFLEAIRNLLVAFVFEVLEVALERHLEAKIGSGYSTLGGVAAWTTHN